MIVDVVRNVFRSILFWRFAKFCIVGTSGVVVNQMLLYLFTEHAKLDYRFSSIIAIECAILNNFFFNSIWTWKDRFAGTMVKQCIRLLKFNLSSGFTAFVFNWSLLVLLTELIHMHYLIANLFGIALATAVNFVVNHFWTFSETRKEEKRPQK